MADHNGIIFRRAGQACETWQFEDTKLSAKMVYTSPELAAKLEALERRGPLGEVLARDLVESRPEAQLMFSYKVVGEEVVLSEPTATMQGQTEKLPCETSGGAGTWYMESADCEQKREATTVAGCADAFNEGSLQTALGRITQVVDEIQATKRAEAKQRLKAFDRKLRPGAAVYWLSENKCKKWQRTRDKLVYRSGDFRSSYGYSTSMHRVSPVAEVNLTGPNSSSKGGSIGLGHWDVQPIKEVQSTYAIVGDDTWYFTRAACLQAAEV